MSKKLICFECGEDLATTFYSDIQNAMGDLTVDVKCPYCHRRHVLTVLVQKTSSLEVVLNAFNILVVASRDTEIGGWLIANLTETGQAEAIGGFYKTPQEAISDAIRTAKETGCIYGGIFPKAIPMRVLKGR